MKAAVLALVLSGCAGFPLTVPSTNDARAWRQPWVAEAQREHSAYLAQQHRNECDPLEWPNTAMLPEQHPECADLIPEARARGAASPSVRNAP
jgi:hypothetical protein